jgi:RNA polymerase sigma factor (sigma-70 family)
MATPRTDSTVTLSSDEASLLAIRAGDHAAWEGLLGRHDSTIRSVVAWPKWSFAAHVQDELVQRVKSELVRAAPRVQNAARLSAFIKRICVRRCIDRLRKEIKDRERLVPIERTGRDGETHALQLVAGDAFDPVLAVMDAERAAGLALALDAVGETCKQAVRMFYLEGLAYKEIAGRLGISVNTVGSRLAKCLAKLRGLLETDPRYKDVLA